MKLQNAYKVNMQNIFGVIIALTFSINFKSMNEFDFFISGIWKNSHLITHVLLHKASPDGTFSTGEKRT